MQCLICNKNLQRKFSYHLEKVHNISRKDYYDKYLKTPNEGKCKFCGGTAKFSDVGHGLGYRNFCSRSCSFSYTHKCIQEDESRRQIWSDRSSQTMTEMWKDESTATKWRSQIAEYQRLCGGVEARVKARRKVDPEYNLLIAKIRSDNSTSYKREVFDDYNFRSSWEVNFARYLVENKIPYEYEAFYFENDTLGYIPDFYFKSYNLLIEIKPFKLINDNVEEKAELARSNGFKFQYMTEYNWEETKLQILSLYSNLRK